MVETQIHAGGSSPAPLVYNVASTEEFTLLAVNATFDGSGAGAAWLPAVEVVSDSGQVIARHITGETVAAGGSAETTFAPFLRSTAAAAASSTPPFCAAGINGPYPVLNNTLTNIGIDPGALQDSGAGVFAEDITAGGVTGVKIKTAGTYLGVYGVQYTDSLGAALANPQNFVSFAQDVSGSIFVGLDTLGSLAARGFVSLITLDSRFENSWQALFTTHGATAAGDPIIFHTKQVTGVDLHAYTQVAVFQILPTALF